MKTKSRTTLSNEYLMMAVKTELDRATKNYGPMASSHEAYAVIKEEIDEYWLEVMKKPAERDRKRMQAELIQIAAMAMRAVIDTCG